MRATRVPGSFRDPAGHVLVADGTLYRQIEPAGREAYARLMQSGLYESLVADGLLLPHEEVGGSPEQDPPYAPQEHGAIVIRPERIPMISYPYEWCFSELRDAALLTLRVQRKALQFGMSLKDASAYNVQFRRGQAVLIDTLSFEPRRNGPWVAYRQFCQHFYAPLLLWGAADARLARLAQVFVDGVPLALASKLLPRRSFLRAGPLLHIHLHATAERRLAGRIRLRSASFGGQEAPPYEKESDATVVGRPTDNEVVGRPLTGRQEGGDRRIEALIESLEGAIESTRWRPPRTEWSSYYADQPGYGPEAFSRKLELVSGWLERLKPAVVWDLGANTGRFSRIVAQHGSLAVAFDADPACVETIYREGRAQNLERLLPLVTDLVNPSPAVGWANEERLTLEQRGPADVLLALALVHHLAIGNNVPLPAIATYFARLGRHVIIEFVPQSDPMVQRMLANRGNLFDAYTAEQFEQAFAARFRVEQAVALAPSDRVLYLMTAR